MKKQIALLSFFLLSLLIVSLNAQNIVIPDPHLKAKLILPIMHIDMNQDGEIQQSEANVVTYMNISNANIDSLTGIQAFINLDTLICAGNHLHNLDMVELTHIQYLDCHGNSFGVLNISGLNYLQEIDCSSSLVTSFNISACPNLFSLRCSTNQISSLDLSNLPSLKTVNCNDNNLTSLTFNNLPLLDNLNCSFNQLTTLDISNLPKLYVLSCSNNQLTALDFSYSPKMWAVTCSYNLLTSIDLSNSPNLTLLLCNDNPLLSFLFLKNGRKENGVNFINNPNLKYICADISQIADLQQTVATNGMTNILINSFCSFTPGGNYNTVSGRNTYDNDMNGCSIQDSVCSNQLIKITNAIDTGYISTDNSGNYAAFLDTGNYTLTPLSQNTTYYSISPSSANVYFANNNNTLQTRDFCIEPNGIFPDIEIQFIPLEPARPGFNVPYKVLIHNKGTTMLSGNIMLDFMGNKMNLISASITPASQTANQLTWNYSNLAPFETLIINLNMHILPLPTNTINDIVNFTATAPLSNDSYAADNNFTLNQTLIGPWDPNDKTCLEGNLISPSYIGNYLHYLIRFQNTGTFYAENVVVVDSIDANKFDISSLQLLETSHSAKMKVEGNVLQFYFEGIMLQDSFTNEPESHGFILFKIKTKDNLAVNTTVKNRASIYFDYNLPVITNTENTTFAYATGINIPSQNIDFQYYPNPAENFLTLETQEEKEFEILNMLGIVIFRKTILRKENIDVSNFPKGIYWIREQNTTKGVHFVKE